MYGVIILWHQLVSQQFYYSMLKMKPHVSSNASDLKFCSLIISKYSWNKRIDVEKSPFLPSSLNHPFCSPEANAVDFLHSLQEIPRYCCKNVHTCIT